MLALVVVPPGVHFTVPRRVATLDDRALASFKSEFARGQNRLSCPTRKSGFNVLDTSADRKKTLRSPLLLTNAGSEDECTVGVTTRAPRLDPCR